MRMPLYVDLPFQGVRMLSRVPSLAAQCCVKAKDLDTTVPQRKFYILPPAV